MKADISSGGASPPSYMDKLSLFSSGISFATQRSICWPALNGHRSPSNLMLFGLTFAGSSPSSSQITVNVPSLFTLSTVAGYHSSSSSKSASTRSPGSYSGASGGRWTNFMWLLCKRPSVTAPISMKAPYCWMLLTSPVIFCPLCSVVISNLGAIFRMPSSGLIVYSSPSSSHITVKVPSPLSRWIIPSYQVSSSAYKALTASPTWKGVAGSTSAIFFLI
mmetsp:Transcript_44019/g.133323  ORF Transcript_44019/g.133323 Transcript_44019/m.133323 type:complete len:220 (-) Transcript_44019:806-1465(-)